MSRVVFVCLALLAALFAVNASGQVEGERSMSSMSNRDNSPQTQQEVNIIFATYAESDEGLRCVRFLAESIREFAGKFRNAPIWVYVPEALAASDGDVMGRLRQLGVDIKTSSIPPDAAWFYYAGKTFAAGVAEAAADGKTTVLVWMDSDTVVLQEPGAFDLGRGIGFAYRPVMHNRSGSLYAEPPDAFWSRIYDKLALDADSLFSMVTPADRQTIRAYFNSGLLVTRPEHKILRHWGESFKALYRDSVLARMCQEDVDKRIFLHQTALVGAVMHALGKEAMIELSEQYNYPIFFKKMYGAEAEFDNIEDIVTLRYDVYFSNPEPDWSDQLKGPAKVLTWMKERLGKQ